jgi:hypothetical protein
MSETSNKIDCVILTSFNEKEEPVSQESFSTLTYYENPTLIDKPKVLAKNGIRRIVGEKYRLDGTLDETFENFYNVNGYLIRTILTDSSGKKRVSEYSQEKCKIILVALDKVLNVVLRKEIPQKDFRNVFPTLEVFKDIKYRKDLGIRKLLKVAFHPNGNFMSEFEIIFAEDGRKLKKYSKNEIGEIWPDEHPPNAT